MKKHNKFKKLDSIQFRDLIFKGVQKRKKRWKSYEDYNHLHKFDDETYEPGLKNYFWAIYLDRIDIVEEHFKRGERKLNENYDFRPALNVIVELPLIKAIKAKSYRSMFFLLEHGADPNAYCLKTKMTPYQYAEQKSLRALRIFNDFKKGIKTKVKLKYQPKEKSLFPKYEEKLEKTHVPTDTWQMIKYDRDDLLKSRLEKGFSHINENFVLRGGYFNVLLHLPLIIALKYHAYKVLKLLLEYGADPKIPCSKIWMNAEQYAKENDQKAYEIILEHLKGVENETK